MKRTLKYLLSLALLLGAFLPLTAARADGAGIITGDRVNLRSGPSTAYSRLTYLNRGDTVTVTGTSGNWYAVTFGSYSGYVHKDYVSYSGSSGSAASAQTGTVTGDRVNLRSGPSTAYSRLTYLNRGDTVTVTGTSGNWYAAAFGSYKGYVHQNYVTLSGGAPSASPSGSTTLRYGSRGAQVKTLQGNLILLGYLSDSADGIYGSNTQAAVRKYQQRNGLSADGVAGAKTLSAIGAEVTRINTVVNTAKSFLGTPYVYGGSSPSTGFDCSGLTQYSFAKAGISIPRVSYEQAAAGIAVPRSQIRIGDLVAFNSPVSHVGIYVGDGKFIHSPHTGDVVKITNLSAMKLTAVRRMTGALAG